eukprot:TRINITY_DN6591_c0_g1_i2.p1 TRINITY_DN6591_c0_g1~~TRINITY_DN6591_c0_g1_i2.p1  ORF type:complete len:514 (+),score=115.84 TRINITY_DN6591_c0_g1_i2:48-1589(+)
MSSFWDCCFTRVRRPSVDLRGQVERSQSRIGQVNVTGRLHYLPKTITDDYDIDGKVLGSGFNGSVVLAKGKASGALVAVKPFAFSGLAEEKQKLMLNEVEVSLSLSHPHICRLLDVYCAEEELYLVSECCEGGMLFDRIQELERFNEADAAEAGHQMLLAINHIHSVGLIHRDIKLENFLYDSKDYKFLKLIDFGFSKFCQPNRHHHVCCGTLAYFAPEVLSKCYTNQCDLWSFGVIIFILLVGYMPFGNRDEKQLMKMIKKGKFHIDKPRWHTVSKDGYQFVQELLVVDPNERLTAQTALQHSWIVNRQKIKTETTVASDVASSFRNFARESKFRRACLRVMSWSITREDREKLRNIFIQMDIDKTGMVSLTELRETFKDQALLTEEDGEHIMEAFDSTEQTRINYCDFLAAMLSSKIDMSDRVIRDTFCRFDVDGSGFITGENLVEVLGSSDGVAEILQELDKGGDGKVSIEDFIQYIKHEDAPVAHQEALSELLDKQTQRPSSLETMVKR